MQGIQAREKQILKYVTTRRLRGRAKSTTADLRNAFSATARMTVRAGADDLRGFVS